MDTGICFLSVIPVRESANDRSQMVTQLLFGETYKIIQQQEKWLKIMVTHDNYEGWIDRKQHQALNEKEAVQNYAMSYDLVHPLQNQDSHIPLLIGSKIHNYDGINAKLNKHKWTFNGKAINAKDLIFNDKRITKLVMKYLHAPYLWGGRSPFGIDCSGLTQNIFQFFNIKLPRDAYQQAAEGYAIGFVNEAKIGDLAFFGDEEKITHVGIILENQKIIHASGKVRIDKIDHYGIFNETEKKYSHKLRIIKRIIS